MSGTDTRLDRGIFRRERSAWIALVLYTVLLYATLTLVYDLYMWCFRRIGEQTMSLVINLAHGAVGLVLVAALIASLRGGGSWRSRLSGAGGGLRCAVGWATLLAIAVAVAVVLQRLPVPADRIHFLQYAPLTVLAFEALRYRVRGGGLYVATQVLVVVVALGDEGLQAALPQRYFGLADIGLDALAGTLSLAFIGLVIGAENYPGFGRSAERSTG